MVNVQGSWWLAVLLAGGCSVGFWLVNIVQHIAARARIVHYSTPFVDNY